jgi:hypothetical protein
MSKTTWRVVAVLALSALALAACGSDAKKATTTTTKAAVTTTTGPAVTTTTAATTTTVKSKFSMTVTPHDNLTVGQVVVIKGVGFTAGKTLGATECADNTDNSGGGCDLSAYVTGKVGADGTITLNMPVKKVLHSATPVTCGAAGAPGQCQISLGELSADPNAERADGIQLTFAA